LAGSEAVGIVVIIDLHTDNISLDYPLEEGKWNAMNGMV
jgi:hypothetical protein